MPNTIDIDSIAQIGACRPHCNALREIYPSGTIVFDMAYYPQIRDKQINVLWAAPLLPRSAQLALALSWYDRALSSASPSWKASLRALVASPAANAASTQLGSRLTDRRNVESSDATATAIAGVGYAAAALAVKFSETPVDVGRTMAAVVVLAQWCAQSAAIAESKTMDEVLDEIYADAFQALEQHGATLPALTP